MSLEKVKAVIWDLDGTLLNSFPIFSDLLYKIADQMMLPKPSEERMVRNFYARLAPSIGAALDIRDVGNIEFAKKKFIDMQDEHYAGDMDRLLFPDGRDLARSATERGLHQILLTNRHSDRGPSSALNIVQGTELKDHIDEVRCADQIEFPKPDRRSVDDLLLQGGWSPDQVLVIGDQHTEAQLAINIGCQAIIACRQQTAEHISDRLASRRNDIINYVADLSEVVL